MKNRDSGYSHLFRDYFSRIEIIRPLSIIVGSGLHLILSKWNQFQFMRILLFLCSIVSIQQLFSFSSNPTIYFFFRVAGSVLSLILAFFAFRLTRVNAMLLLGFVFFHFIVFIHW